MGPQGMGPMTGRGRGFCAGAAAPGSTVPGPGRGFGTGSGHGFRGHGAGGGRRGWRNLFRATGLTGWQRAAAGWPMAAEADPGAPHGRELQLAALERQAQDLDGAVGTLRARIATLEGGQTGRQEAP